MALQEFKCPSCGGAISFDTASQKLKCPYCDTEFDIDALQTYNEEMEQASAEEKPEWEKTSNTWTEEEGMRLYVCKSCGGEIVTDAVTAATSCPFCGNPVVMKEQLSGDLKPDLVIPFKLDKEAAKAGLIKHMTGKRLLPKVFKDQNHLDEIKGIYVPYWLFDTEADASIHYKATRVNAWSDHKYAYTETSYFSAVREGSMCFGSVPADGSSRMDDAMMESIEPYDYSEAVDFQTAYLAGYLADRYDVDSSQCEERVHERIRTSTEAYFRNSVSGYNTVMPEKSSVNFKNAKIRYALLPVWVLNTTYQGQNYRFVMNGQTGKFAGDMPIDKGRYTRWFILWGMIFSALLYELSVLFL